MAHTAPPPAIRRPVERLLGALLVVAGMVLAFIAYSALGHPGGQQAERTLLHPLPTPPSLAAGAAAQGLGASQAAGHPGVASTAPAGAGSSASATSAAPSATGTGQVTGLAAPGSPASTPLVVLDNTGRPEEARYATERFEHGGWTVTDTSTFEGDILSTAAYYDPAIPGARTAAEALQAQFPEIQRVRPKFAGLGSGAVIVILTFDYSQGQTTS
ncbi:LytR C-terminal domain-containing protein [Jatrophihabitans sp.]|uniref:LytR C-terminal domain-containing protein n=1 Tax=Jatrophihabitans sp. TaxID=1932789 RepID=UPI002BCE8C33|nr:LytR C-terminal domain-containing protein [Jatrophihabitans sp.]